MSNEAYSTTWTKWGESQIKESATAAGAETSVNSTDTVPNRNIDALNAARADLRNCNRFETVVEFTLLGQSTIRAGMTIQISGYGRFDSVYIIDHCSHSVSRNGFVTRIVCHKILGY